MDEGRIVSDVYLDFSRAFPKVFDSIIGVKIDMDKISIL